MPVDPFESHHRREQNLVVEYVVSLLPDGVNKSLNNEHTQG